MHWLLPSKEELTPIKNTWETFYDSGFNDDFNNLPFKKKLEILNDIVRQSILFEKKPNPLSEDIDLKGDSYTSSKVLVDYLQKLNIGENPRVVLAIGRNFDNEMLSKHFIVLVDFNGKTYQIDSTPSIGYEFGKVEEITKNKFYCDYKAVEGDFKLYLTILRTILSDIKNNNYTTEDIKNFLNIIGDLVTHDELKGFILEICFSLYKVTDNLEIRNQLVSIINSIRKKTHQTKYIKDNILYNNYDSYKQITQWKEELDSLIKDDKNYKRQLELSQNIVGELKKNNEQFNKYLEYNGRLIDYANINPRYLLEEGLNVVLLKPSSFLLGINSTIRESFLNKGNGAIGEYYPNVGSPSTLFGLMSMRLFHPCGFEYERSMNGPGDLFLIKESAEKLRKNKKSQRQNLAKNIVNQRFIWYDGKEIEWNRDILNLVHTTDDYCEASLHYLASYPEYQQMTRFMYPNPKIRNHEKRL